MIDTKIDSKYYIIYKNNEKYININKKNTLISVIKYLLGDDICEKFKQEFYPNQKIDLRIAQYRYEFKQVLKKY